MKLREKATRAVIWSVVERWGRHSVAFLVFLILVRLLEPEDFGLVALAHVFINGGSMVLDQGLVQAVVQRPDLTEGHLDTAFWVNMLSGVVLMLVGILLSSRIADLFGAPRLQPVLSWLSLTFILSALNGIQKALLQRNLDFRTLAMSSLMASICGGIAGIGSALFGFGVWSLVAQKLVTDSVKVLVLWQAANWRPGFQFCIHRYRELFGFGANIMGLKVLSFFETHLDDLVIGYFLGATFLGFYTMAYRLLDVMMKLLADVANKVAFSTFSRLQEERSRLRSVFYRVSQFNIIFSFPIFLGSMLLAHQLVAALFGDKWLPSVPVLQILAIAGLQLSTVRFHGNLLKAVGKPLWLLRLTAFSALTCAVGFGLVARWGIVPVAAVFAGVTSMTMPLSLVLVHRAIHLDLAYYARLYLAPLVGSAAMATAVVVLKSSSALVGIGLYLQLVICILAGGVTYFWVIYAMESRVIQELLELFHFVRPGKVLNK